MKVKDWVYRKSGAFTIWELLVAMIITSMLVAFSYRLYMLAEGYLRAEQVHEDAFEAALGLKKEMYARIKAAEYLEVRGREVVVVEQGKEGIILSEEELEIFRIGQGEFYYNIRDLAYEYLDKEFYYVANISFELLVGDEVYHMQFRKNYSNMFRLKMKR